MEKILEAWNKLEKEIIEFAGKGKVVSGKDHDLPFRDRMYNFIRKVKGMSNLPDEYTWMTTAEGIYSYLERTHQIKREKKIQPLTLDRLKIEVEKAKASGFTTGDKWRYDVKNYAAGHDMTFEEVMHALGYVDYKSPNKNRTISSSILELETWAIMNGGYLDGVYGSDVEPALRFLYKRAADLEMDGSMYITLMSDSLKFHSARLFIDYMDVVERRFKEYLKVHGSSKGIKENDPELYRMLIHVAEYAPGGSMSMNETRTLFGITPSGRPSRTQYREVDIETEMDIMSVDGVVSKITDDRTLHEALVRMALRAGTTVEGIVSSSAEYKNGMSLPRLSRIAVSYDDVIADIKADLKEAWEKEGSDIEYNVARKEIVAKALYDKEVERVIEQKVKPTIKI